MALSDEKIREYVKRLLVSRMRILCDHGFFGLLLMHMRYAVDEKTETAYTDGERIVFGTDFLDDLSDSELDFVMMHEVMHVALQHCLRVNKYDPHAFNIACDIVVNSNILLENGMNLDSITLEKYGESMHLAPNGKEGHEFTAEEVYKMLPQQMKQKQKGDGKASSGGWDDHSNWGSGDMPDAADVWVKRVKDAAEAIEIRDAVSGRGTLPGFARRILGELRKPQTDWRSVLNNFVQEDICDYSFTPPDRRFDGDLFLPDFNEKEETVGDVLFMIDTSGSMSDEMIAAAYSEILGAIRQFGGKLRGWLGFFDAIVVEPEPFSDEDEFNVIRPIGGGGTNFDVIFEYVNRFMEQKPTSIIILTDGYAPFPPESAAMGIPVLWIINNTHIGPPWGRVARIEI